LSYFIFVDLATLRTLISGGPLGSGVPRLTKATDKPGFIIAEMWISSDRNHR